jgi:hypothetical protein
MDRVTFGGRAFVPKENLVSQTIVLEPSIIRVSPKSPTNEGFLPARPRSMAPSETIRWKVVVRLNSPLTPYAGIGLRWGAWLLQA